MDKKGLTERDICTKFITPALERSGWDIHKQVREEVSFTAGRIIVRGRLHTRGRRRRADYVLSYRKNIPLAVIEAKDNAHSVGDGMQQALSYSDALCDQLKERLNQASETRCQMAEAVVEGALN